MDGLSRMRGNTAWHNGSVIPAAGSAECNAYSNARLTPLLQLM